MINNEVVNLELELKGNIKLYTNVNGREIAYLVQNGEVLATIEADCNQNFGYISSIKKVEQ
jgi:hypothetical protein